MAPKMPLRIRQVALAIGAGAAYDYVKTDIVPTGELWCLEGIAYENETGARGTFRRYIEGHGYNHHIAEQKTPGAGELIFTDKILFLLPGERLTIRQASATAGDVIALYCHGYKVFSDMIPEGV